MLDKQTLIDWDRRYLWHPFTQMQDWLAEEPVIIERGEGVFLIDTAGNRYIDGVASMWTNVHGHNRKEINDAIKSQIDMIAHSTLLGYSNIPAIKLAKKLVEIAPQGLDKVFYSDNGAASVEIALKIAYQYWQHRGKPERRIFVNLDSAYHGDTVGAMSVGSIEVFHRTFDGLLFETVRVPAPYVYRSPVGDQPQAVRDFCLHALEKILHEYPRQVAGIILEPLIQGAGGMITAPEGFLKGVETLAKKSGTLLILDEVMTGIGRTGRMWACQHEDVCPDILCTAKGLSAGYLPLAATLTTDEIYNAFLGEYRDLKTFFHGHTFTGNQMGCAAASANLEIFEKEGLLEKIQPTIAHFKRRLNEFYGLDHVGDVRVCGLAAGVELVRCRESKEAYPFEEKIGALVCKEALSRGVMLRPIINTIVLIPPLQISISELDQLLDTVYTSIETVTSGTFPDG